MNKVPVLILAFNRVDHVNEVMKAIRDYQPERLYLECDGPRKNREDDREAVAATRKAMLDAVDWPCEILTLFREENLGCAKAVNDAITWFFDHEEFGIICEDDIILSQDFFHFCEILLPRYAKNEKIMQIAAQNHSHRTDIPNSYVYSNREDCWGWASWSRAWKKMDFSMSAVPSLGMSYFIKRLGVFEGVMLKIKLSKAYSQIETFNSWAYRWYLSILLNDGLVIKPGVNLAINIGMDGGAHYEPGDVNPYADLSIGQIEWPIVLNDSFNIDKRQIASEAKDFFRVRMIGLRKKVKRIFNIKR